MGGRGATSGAGGLYGRTTAQDKQIRKIARRTADLKNEQYRIIDSDGNILVEKRGSQHEVAATVGEKRDNLGGNISIHNHPGGGTFSSDDLSEFGYGAKEMVVASPEGTYRLINKNVGKPNQYEGWYDMREAVRSKLDDKGPSFFDLRSQARENLKNSAPVKTQEQITQRYTKLLDSKGKEEAGRYFESVRDKYEKASKDYSTALQQETRRLEVKPYHDFYTNNASKYGFKYIFEKRK